MTEQWAIVMFSKITKWCSDTFIHWLIEEKPHKGTPLCDFERLRYEIRPCDVLLIEGKSRVSEIIQSITQSSWSHAALYIGHIHDIEDPKMRNLLALHYQGSPDAQLMIEGIMGKGTVVNLLSNYKKEHIRVCRPRGLSRLDALNVITFAIKKLGTEYDVRHIVDLARFLLPWTFIPRKMRSKLFAYEASEDTKTVCSSMIAEAFESVDFPILPLVKQNEKQEIELIKRNTRLYTPRDFDYSPYFDIIKYPFVEFVDYPMYRKLPWNREGLVSHDRAGLTQIDPTHLLERNFSEEKLLAKKLKKKKKFTLKKLKERFSRVKAEPENIDENKIVKANEPEKPSVSAKS